MKGLRVKIFKEKTFEEVWGELEAKKIFSETIILKIFEKIFVFVFVFQELFC